MSRRPARQSTTTPRFDRKRPEPVTTILPAGAGTVESEAPESEAAPSEAPPSEAPASETPAFATAEIARERPEEPRGRTPIRVELNAEIDGWPTSSRFDVALRGQITSATPADSFSIRDPDGLELVSIQFGHGDEQREVTLSGGDPAFRTGFQVYLPLPGGDTIRISDLWVRARSRDGSVFEEGMRLGCMADQAAILAGPAHDMEGVELPPPPGIVYLESAEIDDGGQLHVNGWTIAMSPIVAVQIFIDGERIGAALQGRERADVATAYPGYPNARFGGFVLERTVDGTLPGASPGSAPWASPRASPRASHVTAQVLCLSGACHAATVPLERTRVHARADVMVPAMETGARTGTESGAPEAAAPDQEPSNSPPSNSGPSNAVPSSPSQGDPAWDLGRAILISCDQAAVTAGDVLRVDGWAACGRGIERVSIEVDGRSAGDAEYGRDRPDVAAEYPGLPANTGFLFEQTIPNISAGSHEIRIVAISGADDRKDLEITVAPPPRAAFRFERDGPVTREGVMVHPITGRLMIEGWALARDGMAGIDVEMDGTMLGQAHYGMARPDVGAAFPDWEGAARSGYTFHCPSRALPDGDHSIEIIARSRTGETHVHTFRITVKKTDDPEETASIRRRIKRVERNTQAGVLDQLDWHPSFHLIVTGDAAADQHAHALTIRSILEQSWPEWRVTIIASDAAEAEAVRGSVERLAHKNAGRFNVVDLSDGTASDTPLPDGTSIGTSTGTALTGILALGDELGRDALGAFAVASGVHTRADFFYADEFRLTPGTTRPEAFFKPDLSPLLLLSSNYIGRPLMMRPSVLTATGATAASLMRDGFHDLALRCTEVAVETYHVPELLSRTDGGAAANRQGGVAAILAAMERRGMAAEVMVGKAPGTWRSRLTAPMPNVAGTGKVSIIVPTCAAKGYVETCFKSLRARTAYKNFEIVCIDNIPDSEPIWKRFVRSHADKVIEIPPPFNWSHFNNTAAAASDGEYLLFLNDDVEIVEPGWLDAMLEEAAWPGVGIVGARLLYPNRTVQHAGMFLGDGMGRHAFRHADETDPGYFGLALTRREVIAVTGACLLVRRDIFERLGRFDEAHDVINNDLDFCLRAHRAGLRSIYTPHATLIHHELTSRDHLPDDFDTTRFTAEWRSLFAAGDPYFNPRLSRYADDYRIDDEGVRAMYAGHPLIDRASVKAILVVKVDHIGDFVTSLPAIRRLKAEFPGARLTALVAPASAAIASVEPAIDECVPFEFFHERSELGEKELSEEDLAALTAQLAPYRFDIAVDLRKHLSTRHLLLCSGARVLAGYDSLENFPWLDVVLEWDGDKALQRKRSHIVDDLLNLVAAISGACESERDLFDPAPVPMELEEVPENARHLFARPVVAIHPGSGNVMRQWPEKHIPPLIELLIERNDISVMLIGGRDDEEKASSIVSKINRPDRVVSVANQVPLRSLPRLLAACALFIGGNSGPKHIAAASGVPTIGIHSGVVDPGEWGPMGERSVALYRDMSCAPCFLAKPEHCSRGLACVEMLDPALVHQMAQMFLARPAKQTDAARKLPAWEAPEAVRRAEQVKKRPRRARAPASTRVTAQGNGIE